MKNPIFWASRSASCCISIRGQARFCLIENGAARIGTGTLFEIADGNVRRFVDASFFGFFSTGKNVEQSGFATAIGTDESDFIP